MRLVVIAPGSLYPCEYCGWHEQWRRYRGARIAPTQTVSPDWPSALLVNWIGTPARPVSDLCALNADYQWVPRRVYRHNYGSLALIGALNKMLIRCTVGYSARQKVLDNRSYKLNDI